jgi:hypothetical protein
VINSFKRSRCDHHLDTTDAAYAFELKPRLDDEVANYNIAR